MTMRKEKKYDAVAEARKIREKLSVKYWKNQGLLFKDLKAAREKYSIETKDAKAN